MVDPARGKGGWLTRILAAKREQVAALGGDTLPEPPPLRSLGLERGPGQPLRLIAEIKRRSPSAGPLSTALDVGERARRYELAGVAMISVLTDAQFFDGGFEHLAEARRATRFTPLLCKDFVIDEAQLDLARAFGADSVLLIVRCLEPPRVEALVQAARVRGLEPFVEVVTPEEARIALAAGARLIGVNARDLDTLEIDTERAQRVLQGLPAGTIAVHLSGLRDAGDVAAVAGTRADAALVGEALMRLDDPSPLLGRMVAAAR